MRASVIYEGFPVYKSEINTLNYLLKSRNFTICEDSITANLLFISLFKSNTAKYLKKIIKHAKINNNQVYIIFGCGLEYTGRVDDCENVFTVKPENFIDLMHIPDFLSKLSDNSSALIPVTSFFSGFKRTEEKEAVQTSHPAVVNLGKTRCLLNLMQIQNFERTVPVPAEILLPFLRDAETAVIKEVYFSGHLTNFYSYDEMDFNSLLELVLKETKNLRFRLGSLSPVIFEENFYEIIRSPKICPFFNLYAGVTEPGVESGGMQMLSLEKLSSSLGKIRDNKPGSFISIDYEYGNSLDLEAELKEFGSIVRQWKVQEVRMFESLFHQKNKSQRKIEKNRMEEITAGERKIKTTVSENYKSYLNSLKNTDAELILDYRTDSGWYGILADGNPAYTFENGVFHQSGSVFYGKTSGKYSENIILVQ